MGRGRQKAKDAKIARQLKYSTPEMDVVALERELIAGRAQTSTPAPKVKEEPEDDYSRWLNDD